MQDHEDQDKNIKQGQVKLARHSSRIQNEDDCGQKKHCDPTKHILGSSGKSKLCIRVTRVEVQIKYCFRICLDNTV